MPRRIVIAKACCMFSRFPSIKLWQAQVIEIPEARRTEVLSRGTSRGFRWLTPVGGQQPPSSGVGAKLEW